MIHCLISGSVYLILFGSSWFIWSWILCRMISMDPFGIFYMQPLSLTSTICWRCYLFSMFISGFFIKNPASKRCVDFCLELQLNSIIPCVCFCVSAMLLFFFYFISVWGQGWAHLQQFFYRSQLFELSWVCCISIQSWKLTFQDREELCLNFDRDFNESTDWFS